MHKKRSVKFNDYPIYYKAPDYDRANENYQRLQKLRKGPHFFSGLMHEDVRELIAINKVNQDNGFWVIAQHNRQIIVKLTNCIGKSKSDKEWTSILLKELDGWMEPPLVPQPDYSAGPNNQ